MCKRGKTLEGKHQSSETGSLQVTRGLSAFFFIYFSNAEYILRKITEQKLHIYEYTLHIPDAHKHTYIHIVYIYMCVFIHLYINIYMYIHTNTYPHKNFFKPESERSESATPKQ